MLYRLFVLSWDKKETIKNVVKKSLFIKPMFSQFEYWNATMAKNREKDKINIRSNYSTSKLFFGIMFQKSVFCLHKGTVGVTKAHPFVTSI